ncbi:MAG: tetratricopeptide repeat protein [Myxococcota bacterium]
MDPRHARAWGVALGGAAAAFDPQVRAIDVKALTVGTVAFALVALQVPRWSQRRPAWPWAALALLLGLTALSLAWSPAPRVIALVPGAVAVGLGFAVPGAAVRRVMTFAAATLVSLQLIFFLAGVPAAGAGNTNWLGLPLVVAIPALVATAAGASGWRRAGWAGLAVAAFGLLVASRAALIGLVGAAAVGRALEGQRRRFRGAPVVALAAALTVVVGGLSLTDERLGAALAGRRHIWTTSATELRLHGHGAGSFPWVFREAQGAVLRGMTAPEAALRYLPARSAHHDLLHVGIETGYLGMALLGAALLGLVIHLRGADRVAALGLAGAGLGDIALQLPATAVFLGLLLARLPPARRRSRGASKLLLAACGAVLAVVVADAAPRWWQQRQLSRWQADPLAAPEALRPLAAHDPEARFAWAVAALDQGRPAEAYETLTPAPVPDLGVFLTRGRALLMLDRPEDAAIEFRAALHRHPALVRGWLGLAEAERRGGHLDRAAVALDALGPLRPHDPRVRGLRERLRRDAIERATSFPGAAGPPRELR